MIDKALNFLRQEANTYLKLKTNDNDLVKLSAIVNQSGTEVAPHNAIGMMLVNVEEERGYRHGPPTTLAANGYHTTANPELTLNLYVMFYANHTEHKEALILLSHVVRCFQGKNVFENTESPQLGAEIEKLILDLYSITFEQQNQIWASIGAKYLPSVLYRVRMLIINEALTGAVTPAITSTSAAFADNRE
jgi:hypothetical protein